MRIAVNTRLLLKDRLEGIGWFTFESLSRITKAHPEHDFLFIFDRPFDDSFIFSDNVKGIVIPPQARHPLLFRLWFNVQIPRVLKKYKCDLFLSPDGYLSLRTRVPSLGVMHDLNFEYYPEFMLKIHLKYYKKYFPLFAQKASRLATVSNYSKNDIHRFYGVDKDKIDVVYNGANSCYHPIGKEEQEAIRNRVSDGKLYFVFVGALNPRKNIANQFLAFEAFKRATKSDVKYVVVGNKMYWPTEIEEVYNNMEFKKDVIFLGHLSSSELNEILASAIALTYASKFEGFGIPIIEAYQSETPVITANATSMPEIAGDAAMIVDPFNVEEISEAMIQLYTREGLRQELIAKGRVQKLKFSWDKTAENLWKSIETLAKEKGLL